MPTCLLGGFLGEYLGRRLTCCLISPLFLAGFLCTALAPGHHHSTISEDDITEPLLMFPDIGLLYFGRVLGGLALGLGSPPAGVYVSEVSSLYCTTLYCTVLYYRSARQPGGQPSGAASAPSTWSAWFSSSLSARSE